MTDNEIIKALKDEVKSTEYVDSDYCDGVDLTLIKSAIDLIYRQQVEIEKLKGIFRSPSKDPVDFCGVLCVHAEELIDKAKSEVIKEFAERLKEEALPKCDWDGCVDVEDIDNLLKEMQGRIEE